MSMKSIEVDMKCTRTRAVLASQILGCRLWFCDYVKNPLEVQMVLERKQSKANVVNAVIRLLEGMGISPPHVYGRTATRWAGLLGIMRDRAHPSQSYKPSAVGDALIMALPLEHFVDAFQLRTSGNRYIEFRPQHVPLRRASHDRNIWYTAMQNELAAQIDKVLIYK